MPTIIYSQNWDADDGTPDDASHWSQNTTIKHAGAGSIRLQPAASVAYWNKNAAAGVRTIVMQAYVYFTTRPTVDLQNIFGSLAPTQADIGLGWRAATNQFACECGDLGAGEGPTITAGTWHKIDIKLVSAATYTTDAKVDDVALTQRTFAATAVDLALYNLGSTSENSTADYYFDDLYVSNTAADFPIVLGQTLLPDADVAAGGWATAPLFSKLNDASDATIISATAA